jgi:hypothetical protein
LIFNRLESFNHNDFLPMNTKEQNKFNQLTCIFQEKTKWNLARVKFLVSFIYALCKLQTVNFQKLAQGFGGNASPDSSLRRIQRFFSGFLFDGDMAARIIFSLLPAKPPYRLCLDRTNWKFGHVDINILTICVCYQGVAIPLLWAMLPKRGNSNQKEREELVGRYISLFGAGSIEGILADREFIGDNWIGSLVALRIHFYFRIKGNMWIDVPGKGEKRAFWLFNFLPLNTSYHYRNIIRIGNQLVYLSGVKTVNKEGSIEFVIIATYSFDPQTMTVYKDRWQIETMFKAMKTGGFNLEDTHLTDLERISKLLCLLCIAFALVYQVGVYRHANLKMIKVKKHGRKANSFFRHGLNYVAHALLCAVIQDIGVIVKILSCT